MPRFTRLLLPFLPLVTLVLPSSATVHAEGASGKWSIGKPITTYWGGPGYPGGVPLDDATAGRLAQGGWNLVWCHERELDVAHRHGLRAHLHHPVLMRLDVLDNPQAKAELDALITRVKDHPALYSYHLTDEPDAGKFPRLGRIVAYLREQDPGTLAYINLLPTYASNAQLGTEGDKVTAYQKHLDQYVDTVKPDLISYDHYQFTRSGDAGDYFLNLGLIRRKALAAGVPFLNIVQSSSWVPGEAASPHSPRVPGPDELRFLVNTSLAYGAQGISYYIYSHRTHEGGMVDQQGNTTALHDEASVANPAFISIAGELRTLSSLGAYHCGMKPNGTEMLAADAPFRLDPPLAEKEMKPGERACGVVLGFFGAKGAPITEASHVMVVNLDYREDISVTLAGPGAMEVFDGTSGKWSAAGGKSLPLDLKKGGGKLLRVR
ncbi:hypothetical protein OVA24_17950 [Luteolibacter sp. SL250]|uniref:hypothetical protein n=1 Tax=Luteolibacter sp. SL250 TaxID=2995170 RepID=UPI00226E3FA1|nr:hypothetical protein [Luteolibacter sp. SL250]WAC19113.1 hypothetical protein OVA24_17950 [Luteolibacter sp. SL250]